jgi:hypothetical protein
MEKKSGTQKGRKESPSMKHGDQNKNQGMGSGKKGGSRERGWEESPRNAQGQQQQGQDEHPGNAQGQWKQDLQEKSGNEGGRWQQGKKGQPVDMSDYLSGQGRDKEINLGDPTSSGCLTKLLAPIKRGCFPNLVILILPMIAIGLVLMLVL